MTDEEHIYIAENIAGIRNKIAVAAKKAGRDPADITLLAAAKNRSAKEISAARKYGIDAVGENRVQELLSKYDEDAYGDLPLHYIGPLQTNKVKYLIGKTSLIQSVDSQRLGNFISNLSVRAKVQTDILLEVNIGLETTKAGVEPDKAVELARHLLSLPGVVLRGLMAIPPQEKSEASFEKLRKMYENIKKDVPKGFDILSMGMSGDYEKAIEYGSTIVRIGRGIFEKA